jgi:hypothetical protein
LIERLGASESAPRKAAAWVTEKLISLKLRLDDKTVGSLWRLEALETLSLGIEGKLALWRALAVAKLRAELEKPDYQVLVNRAINQRAAVEGARLKAAKAAPGNSA